MAKKVCNHCGIEKDEEEFNWRYKALGIRHPTCRECAHSFNKDYYEGDAKERHLQQIKEQRQLEKLQESMFTSTFFPILVRAAEKEIPVFWSFTMSGKRIWQSLGW